MDSLKEGVRWFGRTKVRGGVKVNRVLVTGGKALPALLALSAIPSK